MKRFFCVLLTLIILLGCSSIAMASVVSDTDLVHVDYPSTDSDIPVLIAPAPELTDYESNDNSWDALMEEFMTANRINPDTVTFGYYNTVTGEEHYFNGDKRMTAASVNKMPLNMYYAEKLYNGEITWETKFNGVAYKLGQEYSIRYSNNDYTNALIAAIGRYPDYRKAILPYIGLEEADVEYAYLTVNQFTAEQIMYCLKLLHSDPERYPGVIDNMLLATPGEYFEQQVTDYEIAQKYGWYNEEGHNYINCVGIVETEEPILLAVFSDNCGMGKYLLGEYCALMVKYTEESIAFRKAEAEKKAEEEAAAAETPAPEVSEEPQPTPDAIIPPEDIEEQPKERSSEEENTIRTVGCIIACAILAGAIGLIFRKKNAPADSDARPGALRTIAFLLLSLAAIAAIIATIVVCSRGLEARPHIMDEGEDPAIVAEEFLALALEGKGAEAEELLLGNSTLGLGAKPEDTIGAMMYDALLDSFSYELSGPCQEDSIDASQVFTVTYLDLTAITSQQKEATTARLEEYVNEADKLQDVFAEDGGYLPELAMAALEEVTEELLARAEDYYVQTELELHLRYSNGEWKVIADGDLFTILSGNTSH
ncbi:MAG: hypothetical protein IKV79_00950 [Oscillospiraceae bacterium]|nr:hypothetical protein [Oscillospiraceae bacterium]